MKISILILSLTYSGILCAVPGPENVDAMTREVAGVRTASIVLNCNINMQTIGYIYHEYLSKSGLSEDETDKRGIDMERWVKLYLSNKKLIEHIRQDHTCDTIYAWHNELLNKLNKFSKDQ